MKRSLQVLIICGLIVMAIPRFTSAIDLSKGIILDIPQEKIQSQFGKMPASQLIREDCVKMASFRLTTGLTLPMPQVTAKTESLSVGLQKFLTSDRSRPTFAEPDTFDTPSGYFRIHYTITGNDSVYQAHVDVNPADGIPDYVNRCADILDSVKAIEIDSLGYNEPPSDSGFPDNGGDGRYDIYLIYFSPLYFGYVEAENFSPYPKVTSYIVLRSDYSLYPGYDDPLDYLRIASAHQFFHAIQFGYDATEFEYSGDPPEYKPYWMEMSAEWAEEEVYDSINDYLNYLRYYFGYPWLSLKTFSYSTADPAKYFHAYASCIFPIFLSERFNPEIIRRIWEKCAEIPGDNFLAATDEVLNEPPYFSSLEDAFREFTVWNFFTCIRADTVNSYSEGNLFDTLSMIKPVPGQYHTSYPAHPPDPLPHPPEHLGSNYVYFVPDGTNRDLKIGFSGDSTVSWQVSVIGYRSGDPPFISQFSLDSLQNGTMDIHHWNSYSDIVMVPSVTSGQDGEFDYSYEALPFLRGDVNADGVIDIGDIVYLINYLYKSGPAPDPLEAGDANCDGVIDVGDVVYLLNYLFKNGPAPGCP